MTRYLVATDDCPTPELAWEDSEGWVYCDDHADPDDILEECWFIPVPDGLIADNEGQCPGCYEAWADGLRRDCEAEAVARMEHSLRSRW